jgi:hypothetical protein
MRSPPFALAIENNQPAGTAGEGDSAAEVLSINVPRSLEVFVTFLPLVFPISHAMSESFAHTRTHHFLQAGLINNQKEDFKFQFQKVPNGHKRLSLLRSLSTALEHFPTPHPLSPSPSLHFPCPDFWGGYDAGESV